VNYKIIDNFLEKQSYEKLSNVLKSEDIPWYFRAEDVQNSTHNKNGFFSFCFYNDMKPNHILFEPLIVPILKHLKSIACVQVRANLCFRDKDSVECGYHIDYDNPNVTTGILYFNTCNAKTVLNIKGNEFFIDSIENRMLLFDAKIKHKVIYHTDIHKRYVINFNFIGADKNGNI
jgi:hypothetical protein